jgi:quercetin dioxygenase-like cupin family protein
MEVRFVHQLGTFRAEKMAKTGVFETARMFCDVYCLAPGQAQAPHTHADGDKIYYVLEGEGVFQVGDEHRALGAGAAVLAPAGHVHGVRNDAPAPLRLLVFMAPNPNVR